MTERLLPPREACRRLGISFITLKRWIYSGKIYAVRTPTGRWMIPESEIERIISGKEVAKEVRAVIYARVSSSYQRKDL
ncbi:MAG: recombinase family protein, partial [Crenarchaeota archaeon]|nr:recombinase family protein [Thermoproteota archaeon]